ncbi:hypothetical protein K491DRAFT_675841 [Lophiostoma macrostomum CBS 122681]|uniref:Uncharacterized protein n=1 Tax=Lophiostoma macrostomum CBS 122681 TaxID=1314788 RepID=A0A6A6TJJ5_9PLEO|nr:hypothetical protein K491DRAFT_675841 [Lophiostoma macrostomum CBS 122681]
MDLRFISCLLGTTSSYAGRTRGARCYRRRFHVVVQVPWAGGVAARGSRAGLLEGCRMPSTVRLQYLHTRMTHCKSQQEGSSARAEWPAALSKLAMCVACHSALHGGPTDAARWRGQSAREAGGVIPGGALPLHLARLTLPAMAPEFMTIDAGSNEDDAWR